MFCFLIDLKHRENYNIVYSIYTNDDHCIVYLVEILVIDCYLRFAIERSEIKENE